jgi:hypothetical protein
MAAALFTLLAGAVWAAVPDRIVYQGRLTKSGVSASGAHVFRARFLSSAGLQLWESGNISLTLPPSGDFTLELSPTGVDWLNDDPKLEITVDGDLLSPSGSFASSPYALAAKTVENGAITRPKVNTASFESAGHGLVPPGAIIIWTQSNTCPPGYSRVNLFDGRFPRGSAAAGGVGGANTHTHGIAHTHEMAGHTHEITWDGAGDTSDGINERGTVTIVGTPVGAQNGRFLEDVANQNNERSNRHHHAVSNHRHGGNAGVPSINTTGTASSNTSLETGSLPPFYDCLFCQKD